MFSLAFSFILLKILYLVTQGATPFPTALFHNYHLFSGRPRGGATGQYLTPSTASGPPSSKRKAASPLGRDGFLQSKKTERVIPHSEFRIPNFLGPLALTTEKLCFVLTTDY